MKGLTAIIAAFILALGAVSSHAANVDRISTETGVPVATLQAERASTGLGWGSLENAHLLANASGQSFDSIVALHQSGEGWGKIAHDNGLNLGKVVSDAHRSSQAKMHAQNTRAVHGKSNSVHGKSAANGRHGHSTRMTRTRASSHGSSFRSAHAGFHTMHGTGGMGHGMASVGHGGRGR
jgi:hypothetical protein